MRKFEKIPTATEVHRYNVLRHNAGHWGNYKEGNNGWELYLIIFGIFMVAFLCLIIIG